MENIFGTFCNLFEVIMLWKYQSCFSCSVYIAQLSIHFQSGRNKHHYHYSKIVNLSSSFLGSCGHCGLVQLFSLSQWLTLNTIVPTRYVLKIVYVALIHSFMTSSSVYIYILHYKLLFVCLKIGLHILILATILAFLW